VVLRIAGDRPLTKCNVWAVKTTLCPEPFVDLRLGPGEEAKWATRYEIRVPPR
jgi:hypothetical protein